MNKKIFFSGILLIFLLVILITGCNIRPNISKENTDEEICLAIETNFLKDRCLAYVKEDPNICNDFGCYALARKLKDGSICTTNSEDRTKYWGKSETGPGNTIKKVTSEFCQDFAEMSDAEFQQNYQEIVSSLSTPYTSPWGREPVKNISKSEILSQSVNEICNLDEKECYGACQVSKARCIMAVALVKEDPKICKEMKGKVAWVDDCYHAMAFMTNDVEICNFAKGYTRDECYLDFVTNGIHYVYLSFNRERDKSITESP